MVECVSGVGVVRSALRIERPTGQYTKQKGGAAMKLVMAIIKPFKLDEVRILTTLGIQA